MTSIAITPKYTDMHHLPTQQKEPQKEPQKYMAELSQNVAI
jgi:hypothetical protein